jgi:hypothetical protein
MDHNPGPIIATVTPRPASKMAISEFPDHAKNIQTSTVAIVIPASGVHRPTRRSMPATAAQIRKAGHQSSSFKEMRGSAIEQDRARQYALKQKTSTRPALGECGKKTLQTCSPCSCWLSSEDIERVKSRVFESYRWRASNSMIPRFSAMVTACDRSFAASLESMLEMWFLTVVSPIASLSAICLLALPAPIKRSTSISRELRASSAACSASSAAISGGIRLRPA